MSDNSPPNSFFSLVMDGEGTGKQDSDDVPARNSVVEAEVSDNQPAENVDGPGATGSRAAEHAS